VHTFGTTRLDLLVAERNRAAAPLIVLTAQADGEVVVSASGEIDLSNEMQLRAAVGEVIAARQRLVLDLSGVEFMGTSGLSIIADAYRRLGRDRSAIVVRRPSRAVYRMLTISAVDRLVTIEDDRGSPRRTG
jgi:anti-sigma B factor antagonist